VKTEKHEIGKINIATTTNRNAHVGLSFDRLPIAVVENYINANIGKSAQSPYTDLCDKIPNFPSPETCFCPENSVGLSEGIIIEKTHYYYYVCIVIH